MNVNGSAKTTSNNKQYKIEPLFITPLDSTLYLFIIAFFNKKTFISRLANIQTLNKDVERYFLLKLFIYFPNIYSYDTALFT